MIPLQLTFAILKPHILKNPMALAAIKNIILISNFKVVKSKRHTFSVFDAETFYAVHKNKFFYNRLVTFMTSARGRHSQMARAHGPHQGIPDAVRGAGLDPGPVRPFGHPKRRPRLRLARLGASGTRHLLPRFQRGALAAPARGSISK